MTVFVWDNHSSPEFSSGIRASGVEFQEACSQEELFAGLSAASLVIMNQPLPDRSAAVRRLVTEKIPFAVHGLPGPDAEARKQLAARLKKRHVRACWLGSLRFLPGVFRLKELVNSGVFGEIRRLRLAGDGCGPDLFEEFRRADLAEWILESQNPPPEFCQETSAPDGEYHLDLEGTAGSARWICRIQEKAALEWRMGSKTKKMLLPFENPLIREIQLLNITVQNGWDWHALPVIALPQTRA